MINTHSTDEAPVEVSLPALERLTWVDIGHWLRLLWPILLVVVAGIAFFREAIIATIVATPHPALVYSIFGVCLVAIFAAMAVLHRYLKESKYAKRWLLMTPAMRALALQSESQHSVFMPVYQLLTGQKTFSPESRQAAVTAELESGEIALEHRLELPNFLGGALVGMGLIGTFVGLLGTLEDLSKVFSALVNSGSSTMSPTQMFSDMVTKLQAPMQGMGTAFVASLYGLLGSLIVTLMMVSVRKTAASSVHQIQTVVRQLGYGAQTPDKLAPTSTSHENLDTLRWLKVMQTLLEDLSRQVAAQQSQQELISKQNAQLIQELLVAGQATAASQKRTEEALQVQLSSLRTALLQDADNRLSEVGSARQDTHQLVRSIEECRASFEYSARSLRAVLAAQNSSPVDQ
jgi:MotA/TolQ/ExbB proton channel family